MSIVRDDPAPHVICLPCSHNILLHERSTAKYMQYDGILFYYANKIYDCIHIQNVALQPSFSITDLDTNCIRTLNVYTTNSGVSPVPATLTYMSAPRRANEIFCGSYILLGSCRSTHVQYAYNVLYA